MPCSNSFAVLQLQVDQTRSYSFFREASQKCVFVRTYLFFVKGLKVWLFIKPKNGKVKLFVVNFEINKVLWN